jgi:predicted dehydrogenase/nucleoside-diphosphate-sugar epimerase
MATPKRLQYLVLGGGAVVAEFYLPAFAGLDWLENVWVADPSAKALARLTNDYPQLNTLALDFKAALERGADLGINAVIVALPNALHEPAVALALEHGFDVLCEKPLALTEGDCLRLVGLAANKGRVLGVGMTRRFLPSVKALRQILNAGWLGEIQSIEAEDGHNFAWSSESGIYAEPGNAGVLANVGVHALDLVQYLFGALNPVAYVDDWRGGVEANVDFRLQTAAGVPVRLRFSYTHGLPKGLRVRGSLGEAQITGDSATAQYRSANNQAEAVVSATRPYDFGNWPMTVEAAMREEFCDFADAIVHRRPTRATPRDAASSAALIDWAYAHHNNTPARRSRIVAVASSNPALSPGRIVVTGGTGFVGGHLVEALFDRGHSDVLVPIRAFQRGANTWRFPAQFQRADLLDRRALRELMTGVRHVFHLAFGRDGRNAARVTVEGTQNVVEAAIEAGVESVVVVSTAAVFGDPGGSVDERSPYGHSGSEYEKTKADAERWTLARATDETRTRITVVDPACVFGPRGNTFTELPARLLSDGRFCWIEEGVGIANYVYVGNLVEAILLAAVSPEAHRQRFIVSDGSTTWRDFFSALFGPSIAATIPSYTRSELTAFARSGSASLRDVARTIVSNGELWRLISENPHLANGKALVSRVAPGLYKRVKNSRQRSQGAGAVPVQVATKPPVFLADLFGVTTTHWSSAKAREVLKWTPRTDLADGQLICRAWLAELGLIDGHAEAASSSASGTVSRTLTPVSPA